MTNRTRSKTWTPRPMITEPPPMASGSSHQPRRPDRGLCSGSPRSPRPQCPCSSLTRPNLPLDTKSRASRCAGWKRSSNPRPSFTPLAWQTWTMVRASSTEVAIGFSDRTCFPALAVCTVWPTWEALGEATKTASIRESASRSSMLEYPALAPWVSAKASARPWSRLKTAISSASGVSPIAGASFWCGCIPAPMIAHPNATYGLLYQFGIE